MRHRSFRGRRTLDGCIVEVILAAFEVSSTYIALQFSFSFTCTACFFVALAPVFARSCCLKNRIAQGLLFHAFEFQGSCHVTMEEGNSEAGCSMVDDEGEVYDQLGTLRDVSIYIDVCFRSGTSKAHQAFKYLWP